MQVASFIDGSLPPGALRTEARAKVNLALHVRARRADGYHEIESLIAFADCADTLTLFPGNVTVLDVTTHEGAPDPGVAGPDSLVLRAARTAASVLGMRRAGRFALDKRLPVAAGLGGGSADAAAALRLLLAANEADVSFDDLLSVAAQIGADVPVCLESRAALVGGTGEKVAPVEGFTGLDAVLVNPRVPVSTAEVFAALGMAPDAPLREAAFEEVSAGTFGEAVWNGRNDLQDTAIALCPDIGTCIAALEMAGAALARMSGSGATCFGLFAESQAAQEAARRIQTAAPQWWVRAVRLS